MEFIKFINKFDIKRHSDGLHEVIIHGVRLIVTFKSSPHSIDDYSELLTIRILNSNQYLNTIDELYLYLKSYYELTGEVADYSVKIDSNYNFLFELNYKISEYDKIDQFFELIRINQDGIVRYEESDVFYGNNYTEDKTISIIQSSTKTRRLGYLKIIIELFKNSSYFPISYLNKKIELESAIYDRELLEYSSLAGDDKGLIKITSSGISAKPYVMLMQELNLITQVNTSFILTKQSKIYFHLNNSISKTESNIFKLTDLDKLFFLRQILICDPLYLVVLLDLFVIHGKPVNIISLKKLFVEYVINELDRNQVFAESNSTKRYISEIKNRIKSWKNALIYLEHIIEPRINWLLDLQILEKNKNGKENVYNLTVYGNRFMNVISDLYQKTGNRELVLRSFINKTYFKTFNYIFEQNKETGQFDHTKVDVYLYEAFNVFKTEAPNRIAASQGIDYVCFKSYMIDNKVVEFDDLKNYLQKDSTKFSMDWFKTENDGALYIKK